MLYIGLLRLVRRVIERPGSSWSRALVSRLDEAHRRHVERVVATSPAAQRRGNTINVTLLPGRYLTAGDVAREAARALRGSSRSVYRN